MATVVSGSMAAAEAVGRIVSQRGVPVTVLDDPSRAAVDLAGLTPGSVDCYLQLPIALRPTGETVVGRVRQFLDEGLLTRFRLTEKVMPLLAAEARVILVAGHTPVTQQDPDDQAARLAMLHLLAHSLRADAAPNRLRVTVAAAGQSPQILAAAALDGAPLAAGPDLGTAPTRASDRSYEDWRVEMMGLVGIEV